MARGSHYETLGLRPGATEKEVKAAYRGIALRHHPDRSPDPDSTRIFIAATEAYEVLGDRRAKRLYDESQAAEARREEERKTEGRRQKDADARVRAARAASTAPRGASSGTGTALATQLTRLSMLYSRGLYADAEKLADEIVRRDPRQSLPYAVRGDLARSRGRLDEAARQYSLAIQMDPRNATYLKRYEEVLERTQSSKGGLSPVASEEQTALSLVGLTAVVVGTSGYVMWSRETALLVGLAPVATWTVGLVAMLFLSGVGVGACLAAGRSLDRLDAYAAGRVGPTVALGVVSLVSFPAAVVLYAILGLAQRAFNLTTTRLMLGVGGSVILLAAAATFSRAGTDPMSVLLWGGNLTYVGALCGWAVADSLRQ